MFGMGTGGSLRLLSPERSRAPALRCRLERSAFHRSRCRLPVDASRQYNCLPASLSGFSFPASGFAPSKPHRLDCFAPPTKIRSFNPHILSPSALASGSSLTIFFLVSVLAFVSVPSARFRSLRLSFSLLPSPYSLFPRSSPRPISITKLHALPHFHR